MADNSVPLIAYKQTARPLSDNDKADLITAKLERHAIALEVLSKYPKAMREYVSAVRSGFVDPPAEVTAGTERIDYQREESPSI
jgi:hypothetical protein